MSMIAVMVEPFQMGREKKEPGEKMQFVGRGRPIPAKTLDKSLWRGSYRVDRGQASACVRLRTGLELNFAPVCGAIVTPLRQTGRNIDARPTFGPKTVAARRIFAMVDTTSAPENGTPESTAHETALPEPTGFDTHGAGKKLDAAIAEVEAGGTEIKSRFSKAIEEARASAEALRADAADLTTAARKVAGATAAEWTEQASTLAAQSREKGLDLVRQGKDKTSEAIVVVSRAISDTAPVIDEKLGVTYGDYARSAAGALETSADKLAAKDVAELGADVLEFVRKSPATALGIAAVTGFLFARLFSRSGGRDA
jgi:ElaB/YqjD/DUF883 family membrane-anchored ribosome-binding protein